MNFDSAITLSDLFEEDNYFSIPDYQRPYSWDEQNVSDLYYDYIANAGRDGYFLGTLLFEKIESLGDEECFAIIDGQQRITTIIILIRALLNEIEKLTCCDDVVYSNEKYFSKSGRYRFKTSDYDNLFFRSFICDNEQNDRREMLKTPSKKRIFDAYTFFKKKLQNNEIYKLKELLSTIEQSVILTYVVKKKSDAIFIFETTNDRGKKLTNLEKLKSYLMYKVELASPNNSNIQKDINDSFGEIYQVYDSINGISEGDASVRGLTEDDILRFHFISNMQWIAGNTKEYNQYFKAIKKKITTIFAEKNSKDFVTYTSKFVRGLALTYKQVEQILKLNLKPLREIFLLQRINLFMPLLIKSYILKPVKFSSAHC